MIEKLREKMHEGINKSYIGSLEVLKASQELDPEINKIQAKRLEEYKCKKR